MDKLQQAQLYSSGAIVGAAILFMIVERFWPYNKGQKLLRVGYFMDLLWYGVAQSYGLGVIISLYVFYFRDRFGLGHTFVSEWSIPTQIIVFVLIHDLYIYTFHRLQHRVPVLWRLHEAHHSVPEVDWLSGIRSHPLEILINQTVEFAPLILLGVHPIAILYKSAIGSIYGMFIHSNLNVRLGPLSYVLNGPELHRWHHANCDERAYDKNFATKFSLWDRLFGSYFAPPSDKIAQDYGLVDKPFPEGKKKLLFLDGYIQQVLLAFRRGANS